MRRRGDHRPQERREDELHLLRDDARERRRWAALPEHDQPGGVHGRRRGDGGARARRRGQHGVLSVPPDVVVHRPGGAAKRSENENAFLVTEAVRGHGGRLFNAAGERFMERYDERLELAPRDVVARAIDCEIKSAREAGYEAACVYLSVAHLPADDVLKNFPGIAAELAERGVDMTSDKIPVVPAAHTYLCGGVSTDLNGQTSVEGLFACGETACTGVHGANRLASNSLLEAVVFANRAVKASGVRFAARATRSSPCSSRRRRRRGSARRCE